MTDPTFTPRNERFQLKQSAGWFAAGNSFQTALGVLSDGAFKLFAYLCLEADRPTGRFQATHRELASALGKSKRIIGRYVTELRQKEVCNVHGGKNQFAPTVYQIADCYWPYHRAESGAPPSAQTDYVESVRDSFLALGCTSGKFGAADIQAAKGMHQRAIPLAVVQDALLLGACRKLLSLENATSAEPIASLQYFGALIEEVSQQPLADDYRQYLRDKNQQLAKSWNRKPQPCQHPGDAGYLNRAGPEIVQ
jgi:hypothetical protein